MAQERSEISFETYTCCTWFQVRDKTGTKDLITIMIKAMEITIALTVIRATVAMEAMTTLGTTIPTMDMGRDTQITVVSGFALIPNNKSMHPPSLEHCSYSARGSKDQISWCAGCEVS